MELNKQYVLTNTQSVIGTLPFPEHKVDKTDRKEGYTL